MNRPNRAAVLVTAMLCAVTIARAQDAARRAGPLTDPHRVVAMRPASKPRYRVPIVDPDYGTRLIRITDEPGQPISPALGAWGPDARHVYSKQQPWNATGTLLTIENRGPGPHHSPLILDGNTYQPLYAPCVDYDRWDYRWHPSPEHANEEINVNKAGTELEWFDVVNCKQTRVWTLPFPADFGIGSGEGNVSADGRYVVISDSARMVVVDMDPRAPNAPPYPYRRIGPVYTFAPCSLKVGEPNFCPNGNISISPSGRYIDVKFAQGSEPCDTTCDMHRIFEVDSGLVIRPHDMASSSLRCGSFALRPNGWIFPLKHADMALDPFDHDEDVLMGGRACPGSRIGHVVKVRLRDGMVTALTDPTNEASFMHGSTRNLGRPGWFYVTYAGGAPGKRFDGEIVAVKMDGSGTVERYGHYHSTESTYRSQAQGVPSPDGRRILFASDWADGCSDGCGDRRTFGGYVLDTRDSAETLPPQSAKRPRPR